MRWNLIKHDGTKYKQNKFKLTKIEHFFNYFISKSFHKNSNG